MAGNNTINELEQRLDYLKNGLNNSLGNAAKNSDNGFWKRYEDTISRMSIEQLQWVNEQSEVINSKNVMLSAFIEFLFEQNKEYFVSYSNGHYKDIATKYIDTVQNVANSFVSHAKNLENQVKELQEKIRILESREGKNNIEIKNEIPDDKKNILNFPIQQQLELEGMYK